MTATEPTAAYTGRELRWLADAYEQAQRIRIETGERIRAVLQSRDETWAVSPEPWAGLEPDDVLAQIKTGKTEGPVAILGRTFRRHWDEEREVFAEMRASLEAHPAWPWISRVRGLGPTLSCKLLARLDVTKADTASSFWRYCGLATVPGSFYRCEACGLERGFPDRYKVTGKHKRLGAGAQCKGELLRSDREDFRVAEPRAAHGEKMVYDAYAKKVMYLVGTSFLKSGGPYEEHYRAARERLQRERLGWADGRQHLTALRITEKLFLAHLWLIWRRAVGLPIRDSYVHEHLGHTSTPIQPEDMIEPE